MFPATLFDFNGVLVDDEHVHLAAFRDAVAPLGLSITDEEYDAEYLGYDDHGAFEAILKKAGLATDPARIARLIEYKRPLYMNRARQSLSVFEGAAELVRSRAACGPVAVVSGALTAEIEFGLEVLGVRHLVGHIISAEDTSVSKPDPQGYRMGVQWLTTLVGAEVAARALVVEDSLDGITAAKAADLPTVAVAHSYCLEALRESGADACFEHIRQVSEEQLRALFQRLFE